MIDNSMSPHMKQVSEWWSTGISDIRPNSIRLRGYAIEELINECSYSDVLWLLLRGELPAPWQTRLLNACLVASVDHGPQAPSIAAARMAATCGIGINNAMATGVNLLGDTHGGAVSQFMIILEELVQVSDVPDQVRCLVAQYRKHKQFLPGFGHRFHGTDPRRAPLLTLLQAARSDGLVEGIYLDIGTCIEKELSAAVTSEISLNVDGVTGIVYSELGLPPDLGRGLFVLARAVGILAHAWEESSTGSRIKGPLPPSMLAPYTGPAPRTLA